MVGWEVKHLSEVAQFINGLWKGEEPPFVHVGVIRNTNFTKDGALDDTDVAYLDVEAKKFQKRRLQFGDLILEKSGGGPKQAVGRVVLFDKTEGNFSFSNFTAAIRVLDPTALDARFLHRFLHWVYVSGRTESMQSHSTGIRNLNGDAYKAIKVAYPSLPEQRRIVAILDEAFAGIATAKANAERCLQNARYLLSSELERVFGHANCSPWIPIRDFGEVFDGPHATPKTVDSGPIFLGISALKDGLVDLAETRHVTSEDFLLWTRRVTPRGGDIVFSYETRLGQAALIPEGLLCCLGRRMGLVRVDESRVDPRFFTFQFVSPPFRRFLDSRVIRGATVDRIGLKEFPSFHVWLPDLSKQQGVADRLDGLRVETRNLELVYEKKLAALGELKKSLLHQAFTGEI